MSRTLKQVYSENVYVEFKFESSLRKYERQPTKKIKCEPQCQHCTNHHQRCSPSRPNSFLSKGKLSKEWGNSIQRPSEQRSYISESKSIRMSKQKSPAPPPDMALLQKNIYRNLAHDNKGKAVLQKSVEDINSSIEEEIYFNDFCQDVAVEVHKDHEENDFQKIELKGSGVELQHSTQMKEQKKDKQFHFQVNNDYLESLIQQKQEEKEDCLVVNDDLQVENNHILQVENNHTDIANQIQCQIKEDLQVQNKQISIINDEEHVETPISLHPQELQDQEWILPHKQLIIVDQLKFQENKIEHISIPQDNMINSQDNMNMINQIYHEKCLAFDGGRIHVDTSGQNFYISVRFLNRLKKKCSNMQELTNALISQRPYLQSRKDQIKHELEQYMSSLD